MTAFAGLVFQASCQRKTASQIAAPTIGPQHAPSANDAHSECEWKQGHDEASKVVAPLTAAHLTNMGLLMEAGEDASAPSRNRGSR